MAAKKSSRSKPTDRSTRLDEVRRQQAAQARRHGLIVWGVAAVVVVAIAGAVTVSILHDRATRPSLAGVSTFTVQQGHTVDPVDYPQTPPAGGEHHPVWLNCGVYDEPVPDTHAVHSLEHGAVWVTYRPDLPASDVAALEDALPDTYTILSPYPNLDAPVVASAWGVQLPLEGVDDPRLDQFVTTYRQGPQTPEPGALCSGGTDTAVGSTEGGMADPAEESDAASSAS